MRELPDVEENFNGLQELIRLQIEPGFLDFDEVLEIAEEWADDAGLPGDRVEATVVKLLHGPNPQRRPLARAT